MGCVVPSYVERIAKIKDALESTADNIGALDNPSEEQDERAEVYMRAVESLQEAIDALEELG